MKTKYIIGVLVVAGAVVFGALSFQGTVTPYVDFNEARASGRRCQVMGDIVHSSTTYETSSQQLLFTIVDPSGDPLEVAYHGIMPGNFEQATQVVAKGTYANRRFAADEILVKCPSKYQGSEAQNVPR
jgi:cytochrome c-type biogenesis protein CcmE